MRSISDNLGTWKALVTVLDKIIAGEVSVTEACRTVVSLSHDLHEHENDLFLPFVGVDSETDTFPLGDVRQYWAADALVREDRERAEVEGRYQPWVLEAAEALLAYAKQHAP